MASNSPKELCRVIQWVDPDGHLATLDIATVDSSIDTIGWRYAMVIVNVGVNTLTTWAIQVEASATTGGTYADITGALFSLVGATDDDARFVGVIDLQGSAVNNNRWLQLNGTATGGTSCFAGVTLILFGSKDTEEYIAYGSGETDELTFEV